MRSNLLLGASLLLASTVTAVPAPQASAATSSAAPLPTEPSSDVSVAADQLETLLQNAVEVTEDAVSASSKGKRAGCTLSNLVIRKEWGTLSSSQRKAYVKAVQCLQKKTAKTPSSLVPGAKSRFDDFVATHINQTLTIHYTGTFLSWHRWYIWEYEQALRNECGYTGYQPYWDWAKTAATGLESSPVFDGSDTSMSGNGEFIPNQGQVVLGASSGLPPIYLPAGTGGGCVTSGPFKNMSVNLGPVALDLTNGTSIGNSDVFAYNPRCLKRDLTDWVNQNFANATSVVSLILENDDIYNFQMTMQGVPGSGSIGVHGGGHYSIGGDPGRDVFVSPGDPVFYLHHANIDRTWWIWQMLDKQAREKALAQTGTFLDVPPSPNTTLDTVIDLGYAAGVPTKVGDLLSTTKGQFCYIYL